MSLLLRIIPTLEYGSKKVVPIQKDIQIVGIGAEQRHEVTIDIDVEHNANRLDNFDFEAQYCSILFRDLTISAIRNRTLAFKSCNVWFENCAVIAGSIHVFFLTNLFISNSLLSGEDFHTLLISYCAGSVVVEDTKFWKMDMRALGVNIRQSDRSVNTRLCFRRNEFMNGYSHGIVSHDLGDRFKDEQYFVSEDNIMEPCVAPWPGGGCKHIKDMCVRLPWPDDSPSYE